MTRPEIQTRLYLRGFTVAVGLPFDIGGGVRYCRSADHSPLSAQSAQIHAECPTFISSSERGDGVCQLHSALAALLVASAPHMDRCHFVSESYIDSELGQDPGGFTSAFGSFKDTVDQEQMRFQAAHRQELERFMLMETFSRFGNALRFYVSGICSANVDHVLLDFVTCLEGLLSPGNAEISYRIALNCAYMLGADKEERKRLFDECRGLYAFRSKLVHGAPLNRSEEAAAISLVDWAIPEAQNLCQRVLYKILDKGLIDVFNSNDLAAAFLESLCLGGTYQEAIAQTRPHRPLLSGRHRGGPSGQQARGRRR